MKNMFAVKCGRYAAAVLLAACVLVLTAEAEPVKAAFPGINGKIIYDAGGTRDYEIRVINPNKTGMTALTRNRVNDLDPAWSADGQKVVFTSDPDGSSGGALQDIYMMNADGSGKRRLTDTPDVYEQGPVWSPDGTRIAFYAEVEGDYDLYVINADGTGRIRLTSNPSFDYGPDWSPDGTRIAFSSRRDGRSGIYTMAPEPEGDANQPRRLRGGAGIDLDWSPNGKKIALAINVTPASHFPQYEIFTMNADGTGRTRLTKGRSDDRHPVWSPNGRKIAFARNGDVFMMNPAPQSDTNRLRRITDYRQASVTDLDWQPIPR